MTAVIGVLCSDGAVIGTDSSATFGPGPGIRTIEQPTVKIVLIGERVIIAITGHVGLEQRFREIVKTLHKDGKFKGSAFEVGKLLSRLMIKDMQATMLKPGQIGALVAFPIDHNPYLCEFDLALFQPELKELDRLWYCSMGTAQTITDSFLGFIRDVFWQEEDRPNVNQGIFAVLWALEHAIQVNPGGVNGPPQIAVLEKDKKGQAHARMLGDSDFEEHRQFIAEAKNSLRSVHTIVGDAPRVPRPRPRNA